MIDGILDWLTDPANWTGEDGVPARVLEHLQYSFGSLLIAALIAVPLGLWVGHTGRGRFLAVTAAGAVRAIPTLGLLYVVVLVVGPRITGDLAFVVPSMVVLVVLAIPPLLSGAYAGVDGVDPAARDAARGMGMRGGQVLLKVEVPCALPLILSGARSALLQVVATATIAATVSLGGLGRYLIDGLAIRNYAEMASGAILVAALALVLDLLFAVVQRYVVSPGLTGRTGGRRGRAADARTVEARTVDSGHQSTTGSVPETV